MSQTIQYHNITSIKIGTTEAFGPDDETAGFAARELVIEHKDHLDQPQRTRIALFGSTPHDLEMKS